MVHVAHIWNSVLEAKNVLVMIPAAYSEHTDVFSADSTAVVLPEHTGIKDHPIDLEDDKQPSYALPSCLPVLQYSPSAEKTAAFDNISIIKGSIIRLSRTGTCCL